MQRFMALLLSFMLIGCVQAESEIERSISVTGEGYVEAIPDTLTFSVVAKHTAPSLESAGRQTSELVSQIMEVASAAGVAENRIDSSQTRAWPEYEWRKQERILLGQSVSRTVSFKLEDLDQYPALLAGLAKLKLEQVNPPRLSHSRQEQLQTEALLVAIAAGQRKAAAMAKQVGAKLGPALEVTELGANMAQPRMMMAESARADSSAAQGYSYSLQRISASVQLRYAMHGGN